MAVEERPEAVRIVPRLSGTKMAVPPCSSAPSSQTEKSKAGEWKPTRRRRARAGRRARGGERAQDGAVGISTPFGGPVVPEV